MQVVLLPEVMGSLESDVPTLDGATSRDFVYQPVRVEAVEEDVVTVSLCYRTHGITSMKDLREAPLQHPPPVWKDTHTYRLDCVPFEGNYKVRVVSAFDVPPLTRMRVRLFKYGFVPDPTLLVGPLQVKR
jgi:hypothetical protein